MRHTKIPDVRSRPDSMSKISPKALTAALAHHWDVMEQLCAHARELGAFELDEIGRIIARIFPNRSRAEHSATLQELADRGLIQRLPHSDRRRVHPDVLHYVQALTRERDLGLAGVIRARIEGIQAATSTLHEATEKVDRPGMAAAARWLWQQFDDISQQLDQDRHAIMEVAERAKAMDPSLPLVVRYRHVLEAYDQYIDPMVSMIDSGPGGVFHQHLRSAGDALDAAARVLLTTHGHLVTETRMLRDAAFQSRELRRLGREVMQTCTATLLPLRNELRSHSALAAAVGTVLGMVRKRGARRVLTHARLPFAARDVFHKLSAGPEVRNIMAAARNFQAPVIPFPVEDATGENTPLDVIDLPGLRAALAADGGTVDMLQWLRAREPAWQDATVLAAFHELMWSVGEELQLARDPVWLELASIRVQHHPVHAASMNEASP